MRRAKEVVLGNQRLSARDAIHIALMQRYGITRVMTFDRGFEGSCTRWRGWRRGTRARQASVSYA